MGDPIKLQIEISVQKIVVRLPVIDLYLREFINML